MDKKHECDIIQDLLPLYCDDVCSKSSSELVKQHLETCEKCRNTYAKLNTHKLDDIIEKETVGVLDRHKKKERNAAYITGIVIASVLMIPVIITLLVTMISGEDLEIFPVVVASMMLVAALTVVPLLSSKKKLLKAILSGTVALLLLMFIVNRNSGTEPFITFAIPTIFGLSVAFFPFVIRSVDLPYALSDKKALITMLWDTIWLFLTIITLSYMDASVLKESSVAAVVPLIWGWLIFFTVRYLSFNKLVKAGIITVLASLCFSLTNDIYILMLEPGHKFNILAANLANWNNNEILNANVCLLILILGAAAGAALILFGIILKAKAERR